MYLIISGELSGLPKQLGADKNSHLKNDLVQLLYWVICLTDSWRKIAKLAALTNNKAKNLDTLWQPWLLHLSHINNNYGDHISLIKHHWVSPLLVSMMKPISLYSSILSKKPRLIVFFFAFLTFTEDSGGFLYNFSWCYWGRGGGIIKEGIVFQGFLSKEKWHHVLMLLTEMMLDYISTYLMNFLCVLINI